jgi:hypothetical protein
MVGLFESARTEDSHAALGRALAWTIGLAGFLPLCYWLVNLGANKLRAGVYTTDHNLGLLLWPSPGFALWSALTLPGSGSEFWRSCTAIFATAFLFLVGSFVRLKRSVLEVPGQTVSPARKANLRPDSQPLGMKNPFDWLATRSPWSRRVLTWIFGLLAPLCALTYLVALLPPSGPGPSLLICIILMYALHQTFKIVLAIEGSRQFNQDRQSGALELLLATPLTIDAILDGQLQSLRARFNPVAAFLTITNSLFLICTLLARHHFELNQTSERLMFLMTVLGGITLLWFDYSALTWLSMWKGLLANKHHRSVLSTLGSIMALPWFCIFLLFVGVGDKIDSEAAGTRCILFWIALSIAIDLYFRSKAKKHLQRHFRSVVAEGKFYPRMAADGRPN